MPINEKMFNLREQCHVNTNEDGDRFVGVKGDSDNTIVYFPIGYELPQDDNELRKDIKNLLRILSIFSNKKDRIIHEINYNKVNTVNFPIQAYMIVINYFLEHNGNYYTENDINYKTGLNGKQNWSRTVKTQKPFIQNNNAVYLKPVIRYSSPNNNMLITRINKYCVYESFKKIGWLYTANYPQQPDISFDKNMFIMTLNDKLSNTNNDNDKNLFNSMIAMIKFIDSETINKSFYYGTDKFETIWEKLIDKYFGIENKMDFFPHANWTERYGPNTNKKTSALEPDTIMFYNNKYYVLDAKYYRYGVNSDHGIETLPPSVDINKQITYAQFVKNKKVLKDTEVYNAFLMPYNSFNNIFGTIVEYLNVAEANGDWIQEPKVFERVQGIVIDTRYLLKNYDGNHDKDKKLLSEEIEKYLR